MIDGAGRVLARPRWRVTTPSKRGRVLGGLAPIAPVHDARPTTRAIVH